MEKYTSEITWYEHINVDKHAENKTFIGASDRPYPHRK